MITKSLIKDFFGFNDSEIEKFVGGASKLFNEIVEDAKNNENSENYTHSKKCRYEDGKLVEKFEKEYVNGECTKDEHRIYMDTPSIDNEKVDHNGRRKINRNSFRVQKENKELKSECKNLHNQIYEMTQYIDGLNDKVKKLEMEKAELQSIINNVKKCF